MMLHRAAVADVADVADVAGAATETAPRAVSECPDALA